MFGIEIHVLSWKGKAFRRNWAFPGRKRSNSPNIRMPCLPNICLTSVVNSIHWESVLFRYRNWNCLPVPGRRQRGRPRPWCRWTASWCPRTPCSHSRSLGQQQLLITKKGVPTCKFQYIFSRVSDPHGSACFARFGYGSGPKRKGKEWINHNFV